ncbi:MAG: hypothetical protein ACREUU_15855, partial [Gammaproteobacteria bacterium]
MVYTRPAKIFISAALFLFAIACVMPGLISPAPPTSDPHALSTMIAGTAAAAVMQTEAARPPTATPTLIPTATPTPLFSTEGTALVRNPDGSADFVDRAGGYELKVPPGWLLVRANEQEFLDAWTLPEASDPQVRNFLHQVQKSDPKLFRLFGADTLPEHYQDGFVSNFNVFWDRDSTDSLGAIIETLQAQLPQTSLHPSISNAGVTFTSTRIPVAVIESNSSMRTPQGWP